MSFSVNRRLALFASVLFAQFHHFTCVADEWAGLDLLREHVPMVFTNHPELRKKCEEDERCPYKDLLDVESCWGYENECKQTYLHDFTEDCLSKGSEKKYWTQADFGKLKQSLDEMKSTRICENRSSGGSSLVCTKDASMCRAKNLYLHMTTLTHTQDSQIVVPPDGVLGGYCRLKANRLAEATALKRSLTTWGYQLQGYKSINFDPFGGDKEKCDIVMTKPVVFVQLDATVNLYHHFCDFFNLYLTQHTNNSWFGKDVQIVRWNNHPRFRDTFMDAWKAFTNNEIQSLHNFAGKRICIPNATFAFLPRMVHGLYYSTYLEPKCRGSRMVKAFSDHFLHRMKVVQKADKDHSTIRVTFLQRGGKNNHRVFRRVVNIDALVKRLKKIPNFKVKVVSYDFDEISFLEQLQITHNTDLFIGMHGAGLAHFLFLPDWAVAFELYNCGDIRCYRDLAALRGLRYITWQDESKLKAHNKGEHKKYGDHAKFWNFSFDVEEFIRLARQARNFLMKSEKFLHLAKKKNSRKNDKSGL